MKWIIRTLIAIFGGTSAVIGFRELKKKRSQKDFEEAMAKAREALERKNREFDKAAMEADEKTRKIMEEMDLVIKELEQNSDIFDAECLDLIKIQD